MNPREREQNTVSETQSHISAALIRNIRSPVAAHKPTIET